jgi:hypothetical protein
MHAKTREREVLSRTEFLERTTRITCQLKDLLWEVGPPEGEWQPAQTLAFSVLTDFLNLMADVWGEIEVLREEVSGFELVSELELEEAA